METNELRVGNYVVKDLSIDDLIDIQVTIVDLLSNDVIKSLYPINLNEEWHNKFGVKKNGYGSFEYKVLLELTPSLYIVFNCDYVTLRQHDDSQEITIWNRNIYKRDMYVHEFQNLYFSLSRTELTKSKM